MRGGHHRRIAALLSAACAVSLVLFLLGLFFDLPTVAFRYTPTVILAVGVPLVLFQKWWLRGIQNVDTPLTPLGEPVCDVPPTSCVPLSPEPGTRVLVPVNGYWHRAVVTSRSDNGYVRIRLLGWDSYWENEYDPGLLALDLHPDQGADAPISPRVLEGTTQDVVAAVCRPNEKILWCADARRGVELFADLGCSLIFGGAFAVLGGAVIVHVLLSAGESWEKMLGTFILSMGFLFPSYLGAPRHVLEAWQRARTVYAVTTERVVIITGLFDRYVKWLPLSGVRAELADRREIWFTPLNGYDCWYRDREGPRLWHPASAAFILSSEARSVYFLILSAADRLGPG